jgi:hypothetical protein
MAMFAYEPASVATGVPDSLPVLVLNVAQAGLPVMANVSGSPFASEALGWKAYAWPTVTAVAGEPVMVGAVLDDVGAVFTVMLKGASDLFAFPSLTLMMMFAYEPTEAAPGVPDSLPELVLNVAQAGLPVMANVSGSPFASEALGWKAYA